jgi:hypothetical protein
MKISNKIILPVIESFPSIQYRAQWFRDREFDIDEFMQGLGTVCSGERHALLFVATVWSPTAAPSSGWQFNLFDAVSSWDATHRRAAAQWILNPQWP